MLFLCDAYFNKWGQLPRGIYVLDSEAANFGSWCDNHRRYTRVMYTQENSLKAFESLRPCLATAHGSVPLVLHSTMHPEQYTSSSGVCAMRASARLIPCENEAHSQVLNIIEEE